MFFQSLIRPKLKYMNKNVSIFYDHITISKLSFKSELWLFLYEYIFSLTRFISVFK